MAREILVIKVGTSTLLDRDEQPSRTFDFVAESVQSLIAMYDIVLVTSGAIGFGVTQLGLEVRPQELHKLQSLSMIGQVGLLRRWCEAFSTTSIGQVLVTRRDLEQSSIARLFRQSIASVWEYGAIPIVNENDAVSTEEISFGDNDRLAAEIAIAVGASRLVLMTDQDGIQIRFGTPAQERLARVSVDEVDAHITTTKSALGRGGASSKVQAARLALEAGIEVYIAHAAHRHAVEDVLSGQSGTNIVK